MDMTKRDASWLLGLDLREGAAGPLEFACWLTEALEGVPLHALHIVEADQLGMLASVNRREEAAALAKASAEKALAGRSAELEIVEGGRPEAVLAERAAGQTGMVIGRLAPRGRDAILRLGAVARRLLRRLPCPTIVTPPDLTRDTIGEGPIVLATDGHADSSGAARFATSLARALNRDLLVALVVPVPYGWSTSYVTPESMGQLRADLRAQGQRTLERWASEHGIAQSRGVVLEGLVVDQLRHLAKTEDALMIVTGSRRMGPMERMFVTSVGSELAAAATCPTAVVTPDYGDGHNPNQAKGS
ncbi:hypothetical protein PPSIR1_26583 [Plesiocystis pacifica SIR-1]|uniref:UspA domain-containing protein n=2 Tax=Plesiocystis pacifica TaxID=191768 RepID=A6GA82_9BACT|nr:hypothetical protein PPSIR1_26583 [Plesiocystis pacifica SIR-1]